MDMYLRSSPSKLPLVFWLIPIVIIINLAQFQDIRESAGTRWGALYRIENSDVFDNSNLSQFRLFNSRATLYYEIGRTAPGSKVIASMQTQFKTRSTFTSDFVSNMKIFGEVREIVFQNFDEEKIFYYAQESTEINNAKQSRGEMAVASSSQGPGIPNINWTVFYSSQPSGVFYLVSNDKNTEWRLIDSKLIANNLTGR